MRVCVADLHWGGIVVGGGVLHFACKGDLPFTEAARSPMYKSSTRLQWCACTPAFIRAKIRIPSPLLQAHSGLLTSPVAPSRFAAAVMAELCLWRRWCRWQQARYFSDGQKREIHSVSALRKIPMHGGGSDLAAGLNHVMRGPRGSESLSEEIDFTPKGGRKEGRQSNGGET